MRSLLIALGVLALLGAAGVLMLILVLHGMPHDALHVTVNDREIHFSDLSNLQVAGGGVGLLLAMVAFALAVPLVLLLGVLLHGQRVSARRVSALAVSYVGVLLVFGHELRLAGSHTALGAALVFASAVSYALYMVHSGAEVRRLGALRLTGLASTVACALCLLQFALLRPLSAAAVAEPVIWLSLLNATACTVAPVLMVMMAIERMGAVMVAQTGMIGPLSTILMGVLILGEPFNSWIIAGTALVLAGIWLLARAR